MPIPTAEADESGPPHPTQVAHLYGLDQPTRTLLDAYKSGRLHHAWLIGGPKGVGKATLAWHFARFVLSHPDPTRVAASTAESLAVSPESPVARQVAAGSHGDLAVLERGWNDKTKKLFSDIRVDDVREALGLFQRASASGGYRICIVDSADDLNRSSANALLKVIEEPPQRSLFLIVTHKPGQVLPTLVSRTRRLIVPALPDEALVAAMRNLGSAWAEMETDRLQAAASRSHGSVGDAIRLLAADALDLDRAVGALLDRLPNVDWRGVHRLADRVGMSNEQLETVLGRVLDWIDGRVHTEARARRGAASLIHLAESWETIRAKAREADVLNLDKRPLLLSVFDQLARAAG